MRLVTGLLLVTAGVLALLPLRRFVGWLILERPEHPMWNGIALSRTPHPFAALGLALLVVGIWVAVRRPGIGWLMLGLAPSAVIVALWLVRDPIGRYECAATGTGIACTLSPLQMAAAGLMLCLAAALAAAGGLMIRHERVPGS